MNETKQAIARRRPLAHAPRLFARLRFASSRLAGALAQAAIVALLVIAAPVAAQVTTADVVGVVMDSAGGRLPGVTITARNVATGQQQTAATDSQGNFQILRLAPGRYQISAALDGFRTIVNDVELAIGDRYRFDPRMEIGVISEQILVTGESPVLQTEAPRLRCWSTREPCRIFRSTAETLSGSRRSRPGPMRGHPIR